MTTTPVAEQQVRFGEPVGRWVLLATVLGSGMAMLDATVVNVALEKIGTELDADLGGLQWTLNGYTLMLASFILLGGSLGDRLGRRRVFVIGTAWFAIASALCGLAPNVETLIAARTLQGIGGALLTPGSLAIITASFVPEERSRAIGAWSGLSGVAGALGPFVGGWLVEAGSWRLIFLVNLPVAVLIIAVALRHVPETHDPTATHRLDVPGAALGALGLAGLTYASIAIGEQGASATTLLSGAAGVLALVAFVVAERHSTHPLIPAGLFASRQFAAANVVTFTIYAAFGVVFFLVVLQLQVVAEFSPLAAGASILPVTVIMLALSASSGAVAQRIGPRLQMSVGPLVAAAGLLMLREVGPGASYLTDVLPDVLVFGLGLAILVAPLTAAVLAAAPAEHAGVASGVNNAVARTGGLLAVALLPAVAGLAGEDYQSAEAFASGYRTAMLIAASLVVLGGLLSAVTIRNDQPLPGTGTAGTGEPAQREEYEHCFNCPVDGPHLESLQPASAGAGRNGRDPSDTI
jgi:EmrB/QacA subfamily drug resistance transporter